MIVSLKVIDFKKTDCMYEKKNVNYSIKILLNNVHNCNAKTDYYAYSKTASGEGCCFVLVLNV